MNDDDNTKGSAAPRGDVGASRNDGLLPGYGQPGWGGAGGGQAGRGEAGGQSAQGGRPAEGGQPGQAAPGVGGPGAPGVGGRPVPGVPGAPGAPAQGGPRHSLRSEYDQEREARRVHPRAPRGNDDAPQRPQMGDDDDKRRKRNSRILIWTVVGVVILTMLGWNLTSSLQWKSIDTSEGISLLEGSTVERAEITDKANEVKLWLSEPTKTKIGTGGDKTREIDAGKQVTFEYATPEGEQIFDLVRKADLKNGYNATVPQPSVWVTLLASFLPILLIIGAFVWMMKNQASLLGRGNENQSLESEMSDVTFADVAGEDEAVTEVAEVVDFLKNPARYEALGARIPRGVLLYGPPGTGKTLIAKAVAGEAGVPFFRTSASDFVEMFVGMGASRVRDLFKKAKKKAPAIIFIDELDAVGRGRGSSAFGGNDEREQTLNQLLVEMDGFDERDAVVVIAATNRSDVLDDALLRPGRFDRQIAVDAPDLKGRYRILQVHAKGKPLGPDVDLQGLAKRTPGYSGADLANVLNEAALLAARYNQRVITNANLDEAADRVMAGPQRKSRPMTPADRRMTAYHEGGHALVAAALRHTDPVTKVTILPRGRALGYTMVMPTEDKYSKTRNELLDQLAYALGGRVAEEVVFHDPSTGASNDIEKATSTAREMVTQYGMSSRIGAVKVSSSEVDPLGRPTERHSDELENTVDAEVRALMEQAHQDAWQIITQNRDVLDTLAARLLDEETILEKELGEIFAPIVKAPERDVWLSSPDRPVSDKPPVPLPEDKRLDEAAGSEGAAGSAGSAGPAGERIQAPTVQGDGVD